MSSGRTPSLRLAPVLALAAVLASGCSGNPQQGGSPSAASSPAPETARNGSTVLPTEQSVACDLLGEDAIKSSLGAAAGSLQPSQPTAERTPEGVTYDSCIHAFDPDGATTNALTVQIITYPSEQEAVGADPFSLLSTPEDVAGLRHPAKYSVLPLSGSTEFVLVSLDGPRVVRLIAALPPSEAWDPPAGREAMIKLAQAAKL